MTLTTEDHDDIPDVDAATLDEVLRSDGFGKFAILSTSEEEFIQAGNDWQPNEQCRAFLHEHNSDPWLLEYRESGAAVQGGRACHAGAGAGCVPILPVRRGPVAVGVRGGGTTVVSV